MVGCGNNKFVKNMRSQFKITLKWSLPFLILIFSVPDKQYGRHHFEVKYVSGDPVQASLFSAFPVFSAQTDPLEKIERTTTIARVKQHRIKDPFKPSKFNSGVKNRALYKNPLQGIVLRGEKAYAILAGKYIAVGGRFYSMMVLNVCDNKVVLGNNSKLRIYYLF